MNNLSKITDFLEESDKNLIDVYDNETGQALSTKVNATSIYNNHDNINDWFKQFADHGTVQIFRLKKQGNGYKRITPIIIADLVPKTMKQEETFTPPPAPAAQPQPQANFGMAGAFGMNGAQIIGAISKERDYDRLTASFEREKAKTIRYEQAIQELQKKLAAAELGLATADRERDLDVKQISSDQKSFIDSKIAEKLVDSLPAILGAMKNSMTPAVGMAQPANNGSMSAQKQSFIQSIQGDAVTDAMLEKLYLSVKGMLSNGAEFMPAFDELLQRFQLLTPAM